MRIPSAGLLFLALTPSLRGWEEKAPPLLLVGGRVLDPEGERFLEGQEVLLLDGRIAEISPDAGRRAPEKTRRIDLPGLHLVPGLIDLHTHLLLHPYDEASWDDQVLHETLELRTIRATAAARATLEAGFTTIRDLGTEGAGFADVALRDAVARGMIPGPRILATTRAIVATGCYGPSGFDPRWAVPQGAQEATGPDEVRRAVRQQIAAGADWIKVYADFPRQARSPATPTFSQAELDAIVDEARSAGVPVAAHATSAEGIRRAALAGVETIEHGDGATDEVLRLLRERGVVLCPTLAASEAMDRYALRGPGHPEPERLRRSEDMVARALKAGVTLACGSDAGVFAHGGSVRELELLVSCGMTPAQALRSATAIAAAVLRRDKELGRIQARFLADLVAVPGNPLLDPSALKQPTLVIREGRIALDQRQPRAAER